MTSESSADACAQTAILDRVVQWYVGDSWVFKAQIFISRATATPLNLSGRTVTGELYLAYLVTPILLTLDNGRATMVDAPSGQITFVVPPELQTSGSDISQEPTTRFFPTHLLVWLTDDSGLRRLIGRTAIVPLDPRFSNPTQRIFSDWPIYLEH